MALIRTKYVATWALLSKGDGNVSRSKRPCITAALVALSLMLSIASGILAQAPPGKRAAKTPPSSVSDTSPSPSDIDSTREELFRLLRLSPKLTTVVARDPSLLADESYVARNNPELEQFLHDHPEVVRNPEFYLFFPSDQRFRKGSREMRLEAAVWPEFREPNNPGARIEPILVSLVIISILGALLWVFRILVENSKWRKLSKIQSDIYNKLLDKCGTNEELLAYFRTGGGKPLSELAAGLESGATNPITRVLLPLQVGIVLTLAGTGFMYLRHSVPEGATPFLVLGTLIFTLGIGFIISSMVSFLLARHWGLLPQPAHAGETGAKFAARD